MTRDDMHQIGAVAEAVGLSMRTIRHYEDVGVVVPSGRSPGGFRLYTDADIERLRVVKRMRPLDFTLDEIRDVLALLEAVADRDGPEAVDGAAARLGMYASLAEERYERMRERVAAASQFTDTLHRAVRRAQAAEARGR